MTDKTLNSNLKKLLVLINRGNLNGYSFSNQCGKESFHRLGRSILKAVSEQMDLPKGSFEIRSNKAGMACLGEVTLHADGVYIQLGGSRPSDRFYFRSCKGQKDYTGGANCWMKYEFLVNEFNQAVEQFRRAATGAYYRDLTYRYASQGL
jgi:hypothetical protein